MPRHLSLKAFATLCVAWGGLTAPIPTVAQPTRPASTLSKLALVVVMPEGEEVLDGGQKSRLESRLIQLVTRSGLSANGYGPSFALYPVVSVAESVVVEGGMQSITVTTLEVALFIKQVDNNLVFATINKRLKGSGSTLTQSINNAIGQLQPGAPEYEAFVTTGKKKILDYYQSQCGKIIQKADASARMNHFEQAVATLLSIPEETGACYATAQQKAVQLYQAYSDQHCAEVLLNAKTKLALNKYEEGLTLLASVDPTAKCYMEAKALVTKTESEVDASRRRAFNAALSLEKQRINAVRDIAKAYYESRPNTINYTVLIH